MNLGRRLRNQMILLISITCVLFILFGVVVHGIVTELQMYHFEEVGRNYIEFVDRTLSELIKVDVEYGFAMSRNESIIEFCENPESLVTEYKANKYLDDTIFRVEDLENLAIVPFLSIDNAIINNLIDHGPEDYKIDSRFFDTHPYYIGQIHRNNQGLLSYNLSLPVYRESIVIGSVNLSFSLDNFESDYIKANSYQETGSFIIANSKSKILIQSAISKLSSKELGEVLSKFDGTSIVKNKQRFFYIKKVPFENNDTEDHLYFVFAQDEKELFNERDKLTTYAVVMIVIFILIYIVINFFSSRYYNRIITNDTRIVLEETVDYEVSKQTEELRKIASRDSLTKIYNHAVMIEKLKESIESIKATDGKVCVLMIDIDHFKLVNDNHGHPIGDEVLVEISGLLLKNIRFHDAVGRYGGEEFIVILNETGGNVGLIIAERIRSEIMKSKFTESNLEVTVSIGMAEYNNEDALELIKIADKKLYEAKREGRNQVKL